MSEQLHEVIADELRLSPAEMEAEIDDRFRFVRINALRELAASGCAGSAEHLRWELNEYRLDLVDELRLDPGELKPLREKYRPLGSQLRAFIYARDGRRCGLCGRTNGPFEIDHKLPFSRGGRHEASNLWVTCFDCNRDKGTLTVEEYRHVLQERLSS